MISSKDRAKLRGLAQKLEPTVIIGKNGVSDEVLNSISDILTKRELVKIKLLTNSGLDTKSVIDEVCAKIGAEPVQQIGSVVVVYRFSAKKDVVHVL